MTVADVIDLGIDICSALMTCEANNIIHRDIKPDNIFIAPGGNYKLGDFGVAKQMEQTSAQMSRQGTLQYMAPEVYRAVATSDHSADIYSLGLVLHELLNRQRMPLVALTDRLPTQKERAEAFEARMTKVPIPAPVDGSVELKRIVCKSCEYNPQQRYATAAEMKEALLAVKKVTKSDEPLTANPVVGVGLNSERSDFIKKHKAEPTVYVNNPPHPENNLVNNKEQQNNTIPASTDAEQNASPHKFKRIRTKVLTIVLAVLLMFIAINIYYVFTQGRGLSHIMCKHQTVQYDKVKIIAGGSGDIRCCPCCNITPLELYVKGGVATCLPLTCSSGGVTSAFYPQRILPFVRE